jgi:hypothetical protein
MQYRSLVRVITLPALILLFLISFAGGAALGQGTPAPAATPTPAAAATPAATPAVTQGGALSPTDTVKYVYKALFEKRFKDAFEVSVFKAAIAGLSDAEFAELRPDFEAMAAQGDSSGKGLEYTGEQISGESATVYVKVIDDNGSPQVAPIPLIRRNGVWLFGDAEAADAVDKAGKNYFFNVRMDTHEDEARAMMERIVKAEFAFATQNGGMYTDLKTLAGMELIGEDVLSTRSTGYKYSVSIGKDGKSYVAYAEPEKYGRTGRLSYMFDIANSRLVKRDNGGKQLSK